MSAPLKAEYETIAHALAGELPAGWTRARIEARLLAGITELTAWYWDRAHGEAAQSIYAGDGADSAFERIRALTALPGRGAWYSAEFTLEASGRYDCRFDYDAKPAFAETLADQWYADDLEAYPRKPEFIPPWHPAVR